MSALEAPYPGGPSAEEETARLFDTHSAEILAFCRRQLISGSDAEDALQTTFVYVLRALRRSVVPENERAWLTTIAKNVCHTQRRTLGRRGALSTALDLDRIALAEPEPDEAELLAALPAALATLPDSQRNAIVMREWLGLGPREIATRLELTTPATNALLTRARHSLASALTAAVRGPLSALNIPLLADALRGYLKAILGSAASKTAVAAVVATASVGGVVVQQSLAEDETPPAATPIADRVSPTSTSVSTRSSPTAVSSPVSSREHGLGNGAGEAVTVRSSRPSRSATTTRRAGARPTAASPVVTPPRTSGPAAGGTTSPTTPEQKDAVVLPEPPPLPQAPSLPPLPGLDDPLVPPVEGPPLPPLPELPPVEVPPLQLPPLPPLLP